MPTPNFEDAPDGSSSINHTGEVFWDERDWLSEARMFSQGTAPFPANAGETVRRPQTATEVNEARRQVNPEWRPIPARSPDAVGAVPPNPVGYSRDFLPSCSPPRRTATEELREALSAPPRRPNRRGEVVRKDPNAWSLREAVELCKLLEVVVPEAGFHIALTGGLLHKEGRQTNCDLLFYQIRGAEPNYEILWKYLTVAGVIRHLEDSYNGWLVKATYRGKAVDCLFPNAKKTKKAVGGEISTKQNAYQTSPPTPPTPDMEPPMTATEVIAYQQGVRAAEREIERRTGIVDPTSEARARMTAPIPILYRRSPDAPAPYDPAELLATSAPAPIPPCPPFRTERQAEATIDAAAEAQDDIPF